MSYECYRSCMNKTTREYYDSKMKINKNMNSNGKILKIQKAYQSRIHKFCDKSGKYRAKTTFFTKPIKTQIIQDINPIKTIRMADIIFPLDSSCLYYPKPFSLFHGIDTIKRAIRSEYDYNEGLTTIILEEKYSSDEKLKGYNYLGYFTKWLISLGDYRAKHLSD